MTCVCEVIAKPLLPGSLALVFLLSFGCSEPQSSSILTADVPLHLEELLDAAQIEGSALPSQPPAAVEWHFDRPQPDWKPVGYGRPHERLPRHEYVNDAVRLTFAEEEPLEGVRRHGGLYVDLPDWNLDDWAYAIVRLRNADPIDHLELGINLRFDDTEEQNPWTWEAEVPDVPVIDDGSAHNYILRLDRFGENPPQGTWRQVGVFLGADDPISADLLSVTLVPKEADYASEPVGVRVTGKSGEHRRAIYTHGDSRLEYRLEVPQAARLDLGLGVLREDRPVGFRVTATPDGGPASTLLDETYADPRAWAMRSIDLGRFAGTTLTLALETSADAGTVSLWATPQVSAERVDSGISSRPNVVFYIIDGGGADYLGFHGYNRASTPNLDRLAGQGAVFERAYSSATWTKPSTASFMTSMPSSALGLETGTDRVPGTAVTMAEHMHAAGYQTAVIVSNPYSASLSGLERGADFMVETGVEPNNSESSRLLHESFWTWRGSHPGEPYWVHFQSTDIHEPFRPVAPFSGLYIDPQLRRTYEEWDPKLYPGGGWRDPIAYREHGIDQGRYSYAQQGLYDEAMAHNDYRIGELVARLEQSGEWENTLLVVAADHGYPAACHRLMEPLAPMWGPMFNSHETHVPMLFVWPGRISAGQRFTAPVSMLDVLPTLLDLLDLPAPEASQGQSLAPLLLGEDGWEPRPVILDEFYVDEETGELRGLIEVIDGWWGASLEVGGGAANDIGTMGAETEELRPAPLMLYDLRSDPFTQHSLHEQHPDLVEKYTRFLQRQWVTHRELRERLGEGGQVAIGEDQLEALRALGYIN